jgi:hypothetical protein
LAKRKLWRSGRVDPLWSFADDAALRQDLAQIQPVRSPELPEAAIGKVWWSWFEGGSTDTTLRKIMSVAGVFDIEVVVAHLLLVPARDSTAARVSSNTKLAS